MDHHIEALRGDVATNLQDALLESVGLERFLHDLASYAASALSLPGRAVRCGVNISSLRKAQASAASSSQALDLEHIWNGTGDGPQLAALAGPTRAVCNSQDL